MRKGNCEMHTGGRESGGREKETEKKNDYVCTEERKRGIIWEICQHERKNKNVKRSRGKDLRKKRKPLKSFAPPPTPPPPPPLTPGERCEFNLDRSSCQSHHWHIGTDKHFTPLENIHRTWPWDCREAALAPPVASMFPVMFLNNRWITFQGIFFFFGQSFSWSECMKRYIA